MAKRELVKRLEKLQHNLSFTQEHVGQAMDIIADRNNAKWACTPSMLADWSEGMVFKLLAMLRHVQQARCKQQPPAWVGLLELPCWSRREPAAAAKKEKTGPLTRIRFDRDTCLAVKEEAMKGGRR